MKGTVPNYTDSDTLPPWQCSLEAANTFKKDSAGDTKRWEVWSRAWESLQPSLGGLKPKTL